MKRHDGWFLWLVAATACLLVAVAGGLSWLELAIREGRRASAAETDPPVAPVASFDAFTARGGAPVGSFTFSTTPSVPLLMQPGTAGATCPRCAKALRRMDGHAFVEEYNVVVHAKDGRVVFRGCLACLVTLLDGAAAIGSDGR